jgi:sugar lactone lactonase YvrE
MNVKVLPPPELIDKKFVQKGWELDPNVCPNCVIKKKIAKAETKKEQQTMNTHTKPNGALADNPVLKAVSADTHKAQAKMHQLLTLHFDADEGAYEDSWNDERVSKESGISITHVGEVRAIAYGDIKEPHEITKLRADLAKVEKDLTEMLAMAQKEVLDMQKQLAELTKKMGLK